MVKRKGEYSRATHYRRVRARRERELQELVGGSDSDSDGDAQLEWVDCAPAPNQRLENDVHREDNVNEDRGSSEGLEDEASHQSDSDQMLPSSDHEDSVDNSDDPFFPSGSEPEDDDSVSSNSSPDESPDDSSSSSDSEGDDDPQEDPPLYPGAPISQGESVLSLLSLALAHNLSGACVADILKLIAMHCPRPNNCVQSLYKFKKYFSALRTPLMRRYYCSHCFNVLQNKNDICNICQRHRGVSFFVEMPVVPQVQALCKRPGFYESMRDRMRNRINRVAGNYEDIYDGSIYKEYVNNRDVQPDNHLSFTWYTDGVKIFRSSKYELWPFLLTVNELPYHQRTKIENTIIAGLWFGQKKPIAINYLRFIRRDLLQLRRGINVTLPNGNQVHMTGTVVCGTCDQPAKASFLNMKQHNGRWGCMVCKIETVKLNPEIPRSMKRIFPFRNNLVLRTDAEHRELAVEAFRTRTAPLGVKGPSPLATFIQNPVESTSVDVMHQTYLGLAKNLVGIWFDDDFKEHPASIRGFVRVVDSRLKAARPPGYIQRNVRSIEQHYKYWKAKELKLWLLVYSLPFLEDIMNPLYFDHHKLLVFGITVLSMDSVSPRMIELATRAFFEYVSRFGDLYGRPHQTSNLHLLLHLPSTVEKFGPLWTTTCFPYEGLNGVMKKFVSGTRYADLQVYTAASMFMNLSAYRTETLVPGGEPYAFCERLDNYQRRLPLTRISDRLSVVGKQNPAHELPELIERALFGLNLDNPHFFRFYRLFDRKLNVVFTSMRYLRGEGRKSSCVKYILEGREMFGFVHSYLHTVQCNCERACGECNHTYYAVIKQCTVEPAYRSQVLADPIRGARVGMAGGVLPLIHKCTDTNVYSAVEVHNLISICHHLEIEDLHVAFIVEPVNAMEVE